MPSLSIVIGTSNRPSYLEQCLESLLTQSIDAQECEIIIVDNSTNEETHALYREKYADIPHIQYHRSPTASGNIARNVGVTLAKGSCVAFIDDDAVANPGWVRTIIDLFERMPENVACIGGESDIIFESPRPFWLSDELLPYLGQLSYGHHPRKLAHGEMLFGLNIAFRRTALEQSGMYDGLDRKPGTLLSNSEYPMQIALQQKGYERWYIPDMRVHHHASADRLQPMWMLRRLFWQGVSDAQLRTSLPTLRRRDVLSRAMLMPTPAHMFLWIGIMALGIGYAWGRQKTHV